MSDTPQISRRNLLVGTALTGAATAVGGTQAEAAPAPDTNDPRQVVLKDTAHTRTYYALARD